MLPPPAEVWVAEERNRIVGTAILKPNQPGLGDHVANAGFMVDPAASGHGVGRRLAERILERAREVGYTAMQFNAVVGTNARAVALWRSLGFEIVGTVPGAFRHRVHGPVDLHIMYRRL
jgi:GNAT superfamily N-acetyltransferase